MAYIFKPVLKDYVLGADWSKWNDNNSTPEMVNFEQALAEGIKYSLIKSSQKNWMDEDILMNWKNAKSAGMPRGAYHFMTFDYDPRKQAEFMWGLLEKDPGELPPVCDFEYWLVNPPSNAADMLWNFVERMRVLSGIYPTIYTGAFFWHSYGSQAYSWTNFNLWIAGYTSEDYINQKVKDLTPWDTWKIWQFSDNGDGIKYGGESYKLDLNWAKKDFISQFINLDGNTPIPEPEPTPDPDPTDPPEDSAKIKFEVISDELNIRTEPKVSSATYTGKKLLKGSIVEFDESYAPYENWIFDKNINGWIAEKHAGKQYLKRIEE